MISIITIATDHLRFLNKRRRLNLHIRAEPRTLAGGVYSYIHVFPDRFLFKLTNLNLIAKEACRTEHDYMNIHSLPNYRSSYGPVLGIMKVFKFLCTV